MQPCNQISESGTTVAVKPLEPSRELAHSIEIVRDHIERGRAVPRHVVDALTSGGFYRVLVPSALGGLEMDPAAVLTTISNVAKLDSSTGWIGMIYAVYSFFPGRLDSATSREIYGAPDCRVAGVMAPSGRAVPVEGGYRLTGRWAFASGCNHAQWLLVGGIVWKGGGPEMQGGRPHLRLFFLPRDKFENYDTWHVTGLKGTASHDIGLSDVFIEDRYSFNYLEDTPTRSEPLYRIPVFPLFCSGVAAATIGIARNAVNVYGRAAKKKISWTAAGQTSQADSSFAQIALGRAEMLLDGAEAFLHVALSELAQTAMAGDSVSDRQRAKVKAACINAGINAADAVQLVWKTLGTSALFLNHPLEKAFRDVHTATQHMALQEKELEVVGRVAFGMPPGGAI